MRHFCNANVSLHGTNVEAHGLYIILHMLHLTTEPYYSGNMETVHIDTLLKHILLSVIWIIASIQLSSHALQCEMVIWGTSDESGRLSTIIPKQVRESEYHTLIQCFAFDHIPPCFPHIFDQAQSLHKFISQPQCALSITTFIGKVLEHQESLLTFTGFTWNVYILVLEVIFDLRRR